MDEVLTVWTVAVAASVVVIFFYLPHLLPMAATNDPSFLDHLAKLLQQYEHGSVAESVPLVFSAHNPQTQAIERAIYNLARRAYVAEEELADTRSASWGAVDVVPDSQRRFHRPSAGHHTTGSSKPIDITTSLIAGKDHAMDLDYDDNVKPRDMTISLAHITDSLTDPSVPRLDTSMDHSSSIQAYFCPTCGRPPSTDSSSMSRNSTSFTMSPNGSPLVIPPGPLTAAAFESGMSAVEELQLLKAQVQDIARVCKVMCNVFVMT